MRKIQLAMIVLLLGCSMTTQAMICHAHRWSLAARVGPTWMNHPFGPVNSRDSAGDLGHIGLPRQSGTMYSIKGSYGLSEYFSLGLELDQTIHGLPYGPLFDSAGDTLLLGGKLRSFATMAFVEFRPIQVFGMCPYLSTGVGANYNWVTNKSSDVDSWTANSTLALKGGAGFDYFISQYFGFNFEVAWKYNRGHWALTGTDSAGDSVIADGKFNVSAVAVMLGFRALF